MDTNQSCIQDSGLGGHIELPKILGGQHNIGVYRCTETGGFYRYQCYVCVCRCGGGGRGVLYSR